MKFKTKILYKILLPLGRTGVGLIFTLLCFSSCSEILDIDPPTDALVAEEVYGNATNIKTAYTGLYSYHVHMNATYYQYMDQYFHFMSDEMMSDNTGNFGTFFQNTYTPTSSLCGNIWDQLYASVYKMNDFIEHIEATTLLDEDTKKEYIAVAKWFRAYDHFLLSNLFGDVPLILKSNIDESRFEPRTEITKINEAIANDLIYAEQALASSEDTKKNVRTRLTSGAAQALLARHYLYAGQWQNAVDEATKLIDGGVYSLEPDVNNVFHSTSKEIILGFDMDGFGGTGTYQGYTRAGWLFVPTSTTNATYYLTDELAKVVTADSTDARINWVGCQTVSDKKRYYPYKYKNNTNATAANYELQVFFRLAEQYLIRAEARAHLGDIEGALADINAIRSRAGVAPVQATDEETLLMLIEEERRRELFIEGQCHRWFDLKRTSRADAVYGALDYKKWESHKVLLPIPEQQIGRNPELTQNPGYDKK